MKAILKYDLLDPDEIQAHMRAVKAIDLAISIWDTKQMFRDLLKRDLTESQIKILEEASDEFYSILDEHNINLDELMS